MNENVNFSQIGTLKEFHPINTRFKRRDVDEGNLANQLFCCDNNIIDFLSCKKDFLNSYEKICVKQISNTKLNNFLSAINIYYGIPKDKHDPNYTIYVWVPCDNELESFDDYLNTMQLEIDEKMQNSYVSLNPFLAQQMHIILRSIIALCEGVDLLHLSSLLHLDIKPANFGLRDLGNKKGNNISISLFDFNTIYSFDSATIKTSGTFGFSAPELTNDFKNNHKRLTISTASDIFSIGATLYNSLVILPNNERGLYRVTDFDSISSALSRSLLIEQSEINSKANLHDLLVLILQRCLARSQSNFESVDNYSCISMLIKDLESADQVVTEQITYLKKYGTTSKVITKAVNKEEFFDNNIDTGSTGVIQRLLYEYPLYNYISNYIGEKIEINVLILGCGVYSQKFIDVAFELCQVRNCYLNITVITNKIKEDKNRYLSSRPEFCNYFYVDGQKPNCDNYGRIEFKNVLYKNKHAKFDEKINNSEIIRDTLHNCDKKYSYAFISLVDDKLNMKVAQDLSLSEYINNSKICQINFIWYGKRANNNSFKLPKTFNKAKKQAKNNNIILNPVSINDSIVNHEDYTILSQMAFNCHLLWGDGFDVDLARSYKQFRIRYNFNSSISFALATKYKFNSIGLNFDGITGQTQTNKRKILSQLTKEFKSKLTDDLLNEMTMYRHRCWAVNRIMISMQSISHENYAKLKNDNKDLRNRKHTCIVAAKSDNTLETPYWAQNLRVWDEPDLEGNPKFQELDELDKVSVRLHRHFMSLENNFKIADFEADCKIIRQYIGTDRKIMIAFNSFIMSINNILALKKNRCLTLNSIKYSITAYNKSLSKLQDHLNNSIDNVDSISKKVKKIINDFLPVKLAYSFNNHKHNNKILVANAPFILNYHTSIRLCVPFNNYHSNESWFSNVASSIILNPSSVTYLVSIEKDSEINELINSLENIIRVMNSHSMQTNIHLIIYTKCKMSENHKSKFTSISERINIVDIINIHNKKELILRVKNTLLTNKKSPTRFTAIEENCTNISMAITNVLCSKELEDISTYCFESDTIKFTSESENNECEWFNDIPFDTHLHIDDLFSTANNKLSIYDEPELQQDYIGIWENCYFDCIEQKKIIKTTVWEDICNHLRKLSNEQQIIVSLSQKEDLITLQHSILAPSFCRASFIKIFESLKDANNKKLIDNFDISYYNYETIQLNFSSTSEIKNQIISILNNPYYLIDDSKINVVFSESEVRVMFNSLIVDNFSLRDFTSIIDAKYSDCCHNTFSYLISKGYIISDQDFSSNSSRLVFSSPQIKELLTNAGKLLEIYSYYKVLQNGYFDQVKTSIEVQTSNQNFEKDYNTIHKFDLITVKGFNTQIIEVKVIKDLRQDFYYKLKANGDQFGINKQLILIADLASSDITNLNKEFANRGRYEYNIETIYGNEEILDIDKQLKSIMDK